MDSWPRTCCPSPDGDPEASIELRHRDAQLGGAAGEHDVRRQIEVLVQLYAVLRAVRDRMGGQAVAVTS